MNRRMFNPQVGDIVAFRTWEDMVEEFGLDDGDNIDCQFSFTEEMNDEIPHEYEFVITEITASGNVYGHGFDEYSVSIDMLKPVIDEDYDSTDIESFLSTIKVI